MSHGLSNDDTGATTETPWPSIVMPPRGVSPESARAQMSTLDVDTLRVTIAALRSQMGIPGDIGHVGCADEDPRARLEGDLSALLIIREVEDQIFEPCEAAGQEHLPSIDDVL